MDDADALSNLCADVVSLRRFEPGLVHLLRDTPPAAWVPVRDLYARAGQPADAVKPGLLAARLPAPGGDPGYAVVVFFDDETKWSLTADYNVSRLLGQQPRAAAG